MSPARTPQRWTAGHIRTFFTGSRAAWLAVLFTLLAAGLRLYRLGHKSIWWDEGFSVFLALASAVLATMLWRCGRWWLWAAYVVVNVAGLLTLYLFSSVLLAQNAAFVLALWRAQHKRRLALLSFSAQARMPDGRVLEAPPGTRLADILRAAAQPNDPMVVGAVIDHKLRELTTPLTRDSDVKPVTVRTTDGTRIYRRSLIFLLVAAAKDLFVLVLTAEEGMAAWQTETGQVDATARETWLQMQAELAELTEAGEWIMVPGGHYVYFDQPEAIVDAVKSLMDE